MEHEPHSQPQPAPQLLSAALSRVSEIKHQPVPPQPSQLPLDAEEFAAAQLLLDGALQKEGPAVAGGVSVVGEQDHQQEHHVDEEVLASRE